VTYLKWFGTAVQIVGVFALAGRVVEPVAAFAIMMLGSLAWLAVGVRTREGSIIALNLAFTTSNVVGIARWMS
jgi:hypothetical protein